MIHNSLPKVNIKKVIVNKKYRYGFVNRLRNLISRNRKFNRHFLNEI